MDKILGYFSKNLITIVEAIVVVWEGVSIILNGIARLVPGNSTIVAVHDFLKKFEEPLKR